MSKSRLLLLWTAGLAACALLVADLRPRVDIAALLPDGASELTRAIHLRSEQRGARILAIELSGGDAAQRQAAAARLRDDLAAHGARPLPGGDDDATLRLLDAVHERLPLLIAPEELPALAQRLDDDALDARLAHWRELLGEAGGEFYARAAQRDVLGIGLQLLAQLDVQRAGRMRDGLLEHTEADAALLVLELPFPASDAAASTALMREIDARRAALGKQGVQLRSAGSYRGFRDNYRRLWHDLGATLPISLLLIALVLISAFRSLRTVLALHLPALAAMLASCAALRLAFGAQVPLAALSFAAALLGIAVDYGIHSAHAARSGDVTRIRRPLLLAYGSAAAAFAVLLLSGVAVLRALGLGVVVGLAAALVTALTVLPRLLPRITAPTRWQRFADALLALIERRRRFGIALAALLSIALLPGLWQLRLVDDPRLWDGSEQATRDDARAMQERWGALGQRSVLLAHGATPAQAAARLLALRRACDVPLSLPTRFLADAAEQERRRAAWRAFWRTHLPILQRALERLAPAHGLRAEALQPSLARYRSTDAAPLTLAAWTATPIAALLEDLIDGDAHNGYRIADPLAVGDDDRLATIEAHCAAQAGPVAFIGRRSTARYLVAAMAGELRDLGLAMAAAVLVVVALALRRPRPIGAVLLPPMLALAWSFGLLGWLGVPIGALHLLVAAFVAGIGIDDAVFLATPQRRRRALLPVLLTTASSLAGLIALLGAQHPLIRQVAAAVALGMGACLLACLLCSPLLGGDERDDAAERPGG